MRHTPAGWSLVAFSTSADRGTDAMTRGFRAMCDDWVEASAMKDAALDRTIREHGIDVLVELGGHTAGGRLTALDRKPAPVIVIELGGLEDGIAWGEAAVGALTLGPVQVT